MKLLLLTTLLITASPAVAERTVELSTATPCHTQVVYDRICVGMTEKDIEAAHMRPDGTKSRWGEYYRNYDITVEYRNVNHTVSQVKRTFYSLTPDTLASKLTEKYGEPTSRSMTFENLTRGFGLNSRVVGQTPVELLVWKLGVVTVSMKRDPEGRDWSEAFYNVADQSAQVSTGF